jgi:hypothetical protein
MLMCAEMTDTAPKDMHGTNPHPYIGASPDIKPPNKIPYLARLGVGGALIIST